MENGECLLADDMRLILAVMDALIEADFDYDSGMILSGSIQVLNPDTDTLKGTILTDESGVVYVPSVCLDCVPVAETTESDGAK